MVGVAAAAHYAIGLSWAAGFVLGAVVSPTDPLAATAIARRFGVPRRAVAIIEGESLVNDGTALVLLKFAVAAVVTGSFSLLEASASFVWSVLGGVAVGLVVGRVIRFVRRRVFNPPLEVTLAFLTGYFAFLPASAIGASGVLAVVTAGVYMGWHTPELTTGDTRLQGAGFWAIFNFLLNALLFGLVGLQLRPILEDLDGRSWQELVGYAALVWAVVVLIRIVYGPPIAYIPRWVSPGLRERDPVPPWPFIAFIAWAGMRGAVTLAAALAIPLSTDSGAPFPDRSLIIFLAFSVVLATLVVQGLTLPAVVRLLGLEEDKARRRARRPRLGSMRQRRRWEARRARRGGLGATGHRGARPRRLQLPHATVSARGSTTVTTARSRSARIAYQRLRRELLDAERGAVLALRNEGRISEDVMHRVQRDLDLEESRLDV